jgi:hypothetical protein
MLTELLLIPFAPARIALWSVGQVVESATREALDPAAMRRELANLSRRFDEGLISAEGVRSARGSDPGPPGAPRIALTVATSPAVSMTTASASVRPNVPVLDAGHDRDVVRKAIEWIARPRTTWRGRRQVVA